MCEGSVSFSGIPWMSSMKRYNNYVFLYVLCLQIGAHSLSQSKEKKWSKRTSVSTCACTHACTHTLTHLLTHSHTDSVRYLEEVRFQNVSVFDDLIWRRRLFQTAWGKQATCLHTIIMVHGLKSVGFIHHMAFSLTCSYHRAIKVQSQCCVYRRQVYDS